LRRIIRINNTLNNNNNKNERKTKKKETQTKKKEKSNLPSFIILKVKLVDLEVRNKWKKERKRKKGGRNDTTYNTFIT